MPQLDGWWIQTFLARASKDHARRCAAFFMRRVEHAANSEDWHFRASNYGPYQHVPLQFRMSSEFSALLRDVSRWLKTRSDYHFRHQGSQLFDVMFQPFDQEVIGHLDAWVDTASIEDIALIASLLREADHGFVETQPAFVSRFLARAKQFGKEAHEAATYELYAAATSGMRSGIAGEPFPRDIAMKDYAETMLRKLSRFAPEYELYELLKGYADLACTRF